MLEKKSRPCLQHNDKIISRAQIYEHPRRFVTLAAAAERQQQDAGTYVYYIYT